MSSRAWPLAFVLASCGTFGEASSSTDASVAPDASTDGASSADGGAHGDGGGLPCPANALFCDAFEPRAALKGAWDGVTSVEGATLALDPMLFGIAPSSLRATTIASSTEGDAHFGKALQNVTTTFHVRFAVQFASLDKVNYARFFAGTADSRDFELAVGAAGFTMHTVDTNGALNFDSVDTAITPGVWHQVDYTLVFTPGGSVTLTLDGKTIYAKSLSLGKATPPATVNLRFGVTSKEALDVHYDDFSIAPD